MQGNELKDTKPLPRFRDHEQNQSFDDTGLFESEKVGFGYQTGFRELPYLVQDGFKRDFKEIKVKTIVMENDFLRAVFLVDFGGRLWSLYDKKAERELLFTNPVLRLGNLAIRNAWFSGGIEWNLGQFGHNCLTCEPVFFAECTDKNGKKFLRMYEYERQKCFFLQIDFHLPDNSDMLFAHVKIINPKEEKAPLYWWTNIAVKEDRNIRVFSQSNEVICREPDNINNKDEVHGFVHDTLPYIRSTKGKDASYPQNLKYSCEYFFQNHAEISDTWEAAAYNDGTAFWERSTPALRYRKMFCWGTHTGGNHWKDYLSVDGKGNYVEIQSGLCKTQVHGKDIEPKGFLEFTQVFGGMEIDNEKAFCNWEKSKNYIHNKIDTKLSEEKLLSADRSFRELEDVVPDNILNFGSGWGALEALRKPEIIPKGMIFPQETLGKLQKPWVELLQKGKLPEFCPDEVPASWITDPEWEKLLVNSLRKDENQPAAWLHFGLMLYESGKWQEGIKAMEKSAELCPSAIAFRNLSKAMVQENDFDKACQYIKKAVSLGGVKQSNAFAQDTIDILTKAEKYKDVWDFYNELPDNVKADERVRLNTLKAAFELKKWDFLEEQFKDKFAIIREGEIILTDIWFMVQAARYANKRGIDDYRLVLDEVKSTMTPPYNIDFRMMTPEYSKE